ncbi:multifunctional CCA tRNA nucleotidyl transferase/2'3'-cyclic phosphodiesterase/2'nucleotidase/phosphatase [Halorhodospira abdelmalekii]|uniref:multifunctional CCA addition/repair protein n=1 Tax=Halorhodospira abdelmalekii TaxID=421629 RepID=UPI00190821DB|nr:multifunctional CCA addition/repair protein [Halorhodospira abdelmalekii]MBK1734381.1 multifunctional CCA tRNA nucleotidyl transferase/2'3'-cyclic phosphodiesterase/2'nucleotidase/phosphatase [Halorhodospira abdelmalekii]
MRCYRVGGSVRDELLGLPVHDADWVVVGATPGTLEQLGYRPVGKDFPVFLHPQTREEYALARTERKVGAGYCGFAFHAAPDVSLEQDLARRDLTINAMARDEHGALIDPYGGREDLEAGWLRHVTAAFAEDPVRILRLGRFLARFAPLGFKVAPETLALCREMVAAGEVDALVPERVWQELRRGLMEPAPQCMIELLRNCGALAKILPEIDVLFSVPQRADYHPEGDVGTHTLCVLAAAAHLELSESARFAALVHDVGKALTPAAEWPRHPHHDKNGEPVVVELYRRLRVPRQCAEVARLVTRYHLSVHRASGMRPGSLVTLLERLDAFRRPERLEAVLGACEADFRGRGGSPEQIAQTAERVPYRAAAAIRQAYAAASPVSARTFVEQGLRGPEIGRAVREARCQAVAASRDRSKFG